MAVDGGAVVLLDQDKYSSRVVFSWKPGTEPALQPILSVSMNRQQLLLLPRVSALKEVAVS